MRGIFLKIIWERPLLYVLARKTSEETILVNCKSEAGPVGGPDSGYDDCVFNGQCNELNNS